MVEVNWVTLPVTQLVEANRLVDKIRRNIKKRLMLNIMKDLEKLKDCVNIEY